MGGRLQAGPGLRRRAIGVPAGVEAALAAGEQVASWEAVQVKLAGLQEQVNRLQAGLGDRKQDWAALSAEMSRIAAEATATARAGSWA